FIGVLVFGVCGMANFMIYHNFWHHKYVASKDDPGSAKFGETFYQFTGRNIWGKWLASWRVEKEKLARHGKGPIALGNAMIWFTLGEVVWLVMLFAAFIPSLWFKVVNPLVLGHYEKSDTIPHALPGKLPRQYEENAVIW
ncbi:MAG: hypothetical protein VW985_08795, partial [Gammaproteobacteria bacterium]